jgi:predicted outer membrane repeat protein
MLACAACAASGSNLGPDASSAPPCDGIPIAAGADLNQAIASAELGATLCLAAGTYGAPVVIERSVTLAASGETPGPVILDAAGKGTAIVADAPAGQIGLRGLTIMGGVATEAGGGIYVGPDTQLSVQRCVLTGNRGGSYGGGAIYATGARLRIDQTRIVGNRSERGSSAILLDGTAEATLRSSLIAENEDGTSGPIRVLDGAQLNLYGSTIAANRAAWSVELGGTSTRAPTLKASGAILSHAGGPILWITEGGPKPNIRLRNSIFHGDATGLDLAENHHGDPKLDHSYRPAHDSVARGKLRGLPANWSSQDLLGATRASTPTLGALE